MSREELLHAGKQLIFKYVHWFGLSAYRDTVKIISIGTDRAEQIV